MDEGSIIIPVYFLTKHFLDSHAEGTILNITRVNREHMGVYRSATAKCTKLLLRKEYAYKSFCCCCCRDVFCTRCDANNGIPPPVKQEFSVEVQCEMIEETKKHILFILFNNIAIFSFLM